VRFPKKVGLPWGVEGAFRQGEGWFPLGSGRSLSARRRLVSFGEWKEPFGKEKVGFLGRSFRQGIDETSRWGQGGFPGETLWPRIMMSCGIGCSTAGRGEWGFPR